MKPYEILVSATNDDLENKVKDTLEKNTGRFELMPETFRAEKGFYTVWCKNLEYKPPVVK